jgi:hypothetical protein
MSVKPTDNVFSLSILSSASTCFGEKMHSYAWFLSSDDFDFTWIDEIYSTIYQLGGFTSDTWKF